ncbi:hypothetical protein E2C01_048017 [Portunus trituberculatus]|uniref:Uncharacterized protein n=1 Tax=Portunus trituberculatus TaxID=210409 RepID=A0A5B7G2K6_PORTR|nr:hypothetical protein [Portunus trituberculatus]
MDVGRPLERGGCSSAGTTPIHLTHGRPGSSTRVQDPKERRRNGAGCRDEEKAERYPAVTRIETGGGCRTTSKPE